MTISAGAATDVGRVRSVNEDSFLTHPRLFVVADGMGGHAAGDRASQIAVDTLGSLSNASHFALPDVLNSLATANDLMVAESAIHHGGRGMGTTVAGIAVVEVAGVDHWAVFNIGDSRVYQLDADGLTQISIDHSEVQEMVSSGRLDPQEAATYPRRNVVTRSLGTPVLDPADTWLFPMEPQQVFLICSDGLTSELDDEAIAERLRSDAAPPDVARRLVADAVSAGGRDNVTVVVLRTHAEASLESADATGAEDTLPKLDVSQVREGFRKDHQ